MMKRKFDTDGQGAHVAPCGLRQAQKKGRCKGMMTPKEKVKMHVQIVRENAKKLAEWKKRKGAAA